MNERIFRGKGDDEKKFDEKEFIRDAEKTLRRLAMAREGILLHELKISKNQTARDYLDVKNIQKTIQGVDASARDLLILIMENISFDLLKTPEGKEFCIRINSMGYEQIQKILDTLAHEYGLTLKPVEKGFQNLSIHMLRMISLYSARKENHDTHAILKEKFIEEMIVWYLDRGYEPHPKLLLLISGSKLAQLREKVREQQEQQDNKTAPYPKIFEETNASLQKELEEKETHPLFIQRQLNRKKEQETDYLNDLADSLKRGETQEMVALNKFLDSVTDPREVVDFLVGEIPTGS